MVAAGTLPLSKLIPGPCFLRRAEREKRYLHFSELNSTNMLLSVKADLNTKSVVKEGKGVLNWQPVFTEVSIL